MQYRILDRKLCETLGNGTKSSKLHDADAMKILLKRTSTHRSHSLRFILHCLIKDDGFYHRLISITLFILAIK